eukprot:5727275-Karenia_brevis.AAC.2
MSLYSRRSNQQIKIELDSGSTSYKAVDQNLFSRGDGVSSVRGLSPIQSRMCSCLKSKLVDAARIVLDPGNVP